MPVFWENHPLQRPLPKFKEWVKSCDARRLKAMYPNDHRKAYSVYMKNPQRWW